MKGTAKQANPRRIRGEHIASTPGQVERVDRGEYRVRSQSDENKVYEIFRTNWGWACTCPDHIRRRVTCKHIWAVEFSRKMRYAVKLSAAKSVTIKQEPANQCKFCGSARVVKHGIKKLKKRGNVPRLLCKDCGRHFTDNLGFEKKHASPQQVTMAVELVFSGLSTRKTATVLKSTGLDVSYHTVHNWAAQYGKLMDKYLEKIIPQVGGQWRTDEIFVKIRGEQKYLFAMLDSDTRYWLAKMVTANKGIDDVTPMFKDAKHLAGKVPERLVSDGAPNFARAHREIYQPKNFTQPPSEHIRHIHMSGDRQNNQMEAFNGATVRLREKVTRGLKKEDSAILDGLRVYHNHVRPHLGLPDGQTPGEAAGITIEGDDKILTIIQAAAKSGSVS